MRSPIRAAVVQAGTIEHDTPATVEKACGLIREVAGQGARLAVFPEAFVGGYPKGADFGVRVGSRTDEGRRQFRLYYEDAIEFPGPETEAIAAAARDRGVAVVIGAIERRASTLYCAALFFDGTGVLLGLHRKVMPTAMERVIWGSGDGSTLPVFELEGMRAGAVICWENYMPLLRAAMYAQGVEVYCAPTVDDRETWIPTMRHIALEGRCFVLSACQATERIRGGSVIVSPRGDLLAGPEYGQETIHYAELDPALIVEGRFDLDVCGHYARHDLFHLTVNTSDQTGFSISCDSTGPK